VRGCFRPRDSAVVQILSRPAAGGMAAGTLGKVPGATEPGRVGYEGSGVVAARERREEAES